MSMPHMNRRHFLMTAAAAVGASALAACGAGSSSSTVTLSYWDLWVSQAPWLDNEIKLFQQAFPNIKIKKRTIVVDQYPNLVSLAFKSNTQPDVLMPSWDPAFNDQISKGWLLPVDKWATSSWRAQFPPSTFYEGDNIIKGKLYTAPFSGTGPYLQLYIHNGVFKQAGLTNPDGSVKIPQTWDDVGAAADAITKKGGGSVFGLGFGNGQNFVLDWWLDIFVRGAGAVGGGGAGIASAQDYRTGKWTFATDRNYTDFIQLLLEWKKKGYFYNNSMSASDEEARALFERGKFGMTVGGVWNQAEWSQHGFTDYSLMTLPSPTETRQGYFYNAGGGSQWVISGKTKHPEEAWQWFNWLYSPAAGKRWVEMGEDVSIFPQDNNTGAIKFKPFQQYVALAPLVLFGPNPYHRNPQTALINLDAIHPDINDVLGGIYTGQIGDVKSALSELDARYQKSLDDGIAQAQKQGLKVSLDDFAFPDWDPTKQYITKVSS